jgi:hypothetical protein
MVVVCQSEFLLSELVLSCYVLFWNNPFEPSDIFWQSLCVGMKMWGAVAEINNKDLVVSLPGGLRGFVRAEEASEVLAKDTRNTKKRRKKEKSSVTGNKHGDAVEVLDEVFLQKLWISPMSHCEVKGKPKCHSMGYLLRWVIVQLFFAVMSL